MNINIQISDKEILPLVKLAKEFFAKVDENFLLLNKKIDSIMTTQEQFKAEVKAEFGRIDKATDAIAQKLKESADKIEAQGISAVDEQEILTMLRSSGDKLEGVGKNVPVEAPVETPAEPA